MFSRHLLVAVTVCLSLALGLALQQSLAQDDSADDGPHPTALQLYEQGMEAFEAGEYDQAYELLHRVDTMQLSRDQRATRSETLGQLDAYRAGELELPAPGEAPAAPEPEPDPEPAPEPTEPEAPEAPADPEPLAEPVQEEPAEEPAEQPVEEAEEPVVLAEAEEPADEPQEPEEPEEPRGPTADELMQEADAAARRGEYEQAATGYREVSRHEDADTSTRERANARRAEMQRRIDAQVTAARESLEAARDDIDAGRYDRATERLDEVRDSDVRLGWFDQQRLDHLSERVEAQREAAALAAREAREAEEREAREAAEAAAREAQEEEEALAAAQEDEAPIDEPLVAPVEAPAEDPAAAEAVEEPVEPVEPEEVDELDEVEVADAEAPADPAPEVTDDMLEGYRQARAEQRLAEAREAAEAGQYNLAIRHYEAALQLEPEEMEQIRDELEAVRAQRATAGAPEQPIEREAERLELLRERAVAIFEQRMDEAHQLRQRRDFPSAQDAVAMAKTVLDDNRSLLGERRYQELNQRAERLSTMLAQERRMAEEQRIREAELTARAEQIRQREEIRAEREREVQSLLRRAHELRLDMEYEQALQLIDQALALDPNNWATQSMKISIEDAHELTRQRQLHRRQSLEITRQSVENLEAAIPYSDLIQYPADWPQITERRLRELDDAARESEADRRARLALEEPVPISFDANRLDNVIDFLRNTTGANFFVNWSAMELAGVDQDTPITLHLENIPAEQALRLVLEQAGGAAEFDPIGFSIIDGVVHISTERDLQQTTDVRVYDIRDLLVQVPNFDEPPSLGAGGGRGGRGGGRGGGGRGGGGGGGRGGGGTGGGLFGEGLEDREDAREEMIEEITTLIRESIGRFDEWVEAGGDVSSLREMNGNLIVRTTPGNHRELLGLLDQLRATRAIQISVEARFLLVDQNFLERVGVDLDLQVPEPGGNFGAIRMAQDSISLGSPSPSFLSPFSGQDGAGVPEGFGEGAAGGFIGSGRAFDLTASYLSDIEANLIVTATQRHRQAISLTAPRVTFFNGQHAYVAVVREISYISDLDLVPDAFGFNPTADVLEVGVFLGVEGVVSSDRRYVTLTLQPMLSTLADLRAVPFIASEDRTIPDPDDPGEEITQLVTLSGTIELPETETTAVGATVSIPDQGTLLLGGQRIVQDREVEAGVPVLSKLPLINRLFTNRGVTQDERTLLLLVKPTIIIQQEEEDRRFPGLQDSPEQFNIGNQIR